MEGHPLSPGGDSAIEAGPWHYGADYIAVYFEAPKEKLRSLVPEPFAIDGGPCVAYICEIVSIGDGGQDMVASHPDRTLYHEAAVGVRCSHGGTHGTFYPVMWVTTEWSLLRGLLNGYQKRLADRISMTKLHPLNPGLRPISAGAKFGGFCSKGPETTLSVSVTVERQGEPKDLPPSGSVFGYRNYPPTGPGLAGVSEPVEVLKSNARVSDVWIGRGAFSTSLDLGETKPISGATYSSGFTISGARPLKP